MRHAFVLTLLLLLTACGGDASTGSSPPPSSPPPTPPAPPVVTLPVATALPVLRIDTGGVAIPAPGEDYLDASMQLLDASGATLVDSAALQIRGRGNSTWNYPKKPYRLKLAAKAALLGMPASKHWVLLANYLDKTLIRNDVAFEFSRLVGMAWTPRSVQVAVELNGQYQGIYQLTEHVRIDPERVNIDEMEEVDGTDPDLVTGGYLIEVDTRMGEDYCPVTPHHVTLCFSDPETLLDPGWAAQKTYIDSYIADTENALYGTQFADPVNGYAKYIDVDSAINFYLVHELGKNPDANFYSSVYLYKPRDGKLFFGPVWDFDLAFGNAQWAYTGWFDGSDPTGWHVRTEDARGAGNWYTRLFQDPAFVQRLKDRWAELRSSGAIDQLYDYIDEREAWLSTVQQANFQKWNILDTTLQPDLSPVHGPYVDQVAAMKGWLGQRVAWFDTQLLN